VTISTLRVTSYQMLGLDYPSPTSSRSQDTLPRPHGYGPGYPARVASSGDGLCGLPPCCNTALAQRPDALGRRRPLRSRARWWAGSVTRSPARFGPVGAQMRAQFRFVQSVTGGPETSSDLVLRAILYLANRRSGDLKSGRSTVRPRPWPSCIR
jgi:hypothetical protein